MRDLFEPCDKVDALLRINDVGLAQLELECSLGNVSAAEELPFLINGAKVTTDFSGHLVVTFLPCIIFELFLERLLTTSVAHVEELILELQKRILGFLFAPRNLLHSPR